MGDKTRLTMTVLIGLTSGLGIYGLQGSASESQKVYYGEVIEKNDKAITLNVTPCREDKTLQKISPYEILSSQETSCSDGKSYVRVAVQEGESKSTEPPPKKPDKDTEKDKKQNPPPPDKKGDKPEEQPPSDSPNRAVRRLGAHNEV